MKLSLEQTQKASQSRIATSVEIAEVKKGRKIATKIEYDEKAGFQFASMNTAGS